ncbi:MAG: biliverdin-producing heme oxygenase [Deltaproteobacteria bacterium]|nr:biliverdin-producing heme oxygenase [Deltaproteobacteria bacterium]
MLARLKRETQALRASADEGRLEPLHTTATVASYATYLSRIYGFEAPIEAAFLGTRDLAHVVDLRWRPQVRLLKSDLMALGIVDPTRLPTTSVPRFATVAEALGWMYVSEQNTILHGQLHRHFARWIPDELVAAGCYLVGVERVAGTRLDDLGSILDLYATRPEIATKIVDAACTAFRRQRLWFLKSLPLEVSRDVAR